MATENLYDGIQLVVELRSNVDGSCEQCSASLNRGIGNAINHYLQEHNYKILHVGTDTESGDDGKPWFFTVALLGA